MKLSSLPFVRFKKSESGSISVEAVLVFPLFVWLMLFGPVLFDVVRAKSSVIRNTFTVGDIVSRETTVTQATLNFYQDMFASMHPKSGTTGLRITSISRDVDGAYQIDWTEGTSHDAADIGTKLTGIVGTLPWIEPNESILMIEGFQTYTSAIKYNVAGWKLGWDEEILEHRLFLRPRYATPSIIFSAS